MSRSTVIRTVTALAFYALLVAGHTAIASAWVFAGFLALVLTSWALLAADKSGESETSSGSVFDEGYQQSDKPVFLPEPPSARESSVILQAIEAELIALKDQYATELASVDCNSR